MQILFEEELLVLRDKSGSIHPGVIKTMQALAEEYDLFVVSNSQDGYVQSFMRWSGLTCVRDIGMSGRTGLDKGSNIRLVMERNNITQAAYVGDTQKDAAAAEKAGIPFIFAEYGFGDAPNAALRIGSIEELPQAFLVVSCPCALVISIPLSFFAGIGGASKEGILIKGSNYLEALSGAKVVVFDKTGTLTQGVFEVTAVHHSPLAEEQLLEYAALAECASSHPISKSLQKAYGKEIDRSRVTNIEEISGHGITATVDGHAVAAGNSKLMAKLGIEYHDCHCVGTIIHMAVDGQYAGHIVISDVVKPHSKEAIAQLKKAGVAKTVMLTGDAKRVAESVAAELGVDEVRSELLPADKVAQVEKLLAAKGKHEQLAFVGDGINDAPVLTRADIGIAMGAMGSDAAIEAADVVLMDDDPLQIAKAIKISRKCIGIVKQNIVFSLIVKFGCLALVAFGIANMWAAIFADVGVMVLAVLNDIRALKYKD